MVHTDFANLLLSFAAGKVEKIEGSGKCYLGLSTTKPNIDGTNFNEPNPSLYPSYSRIQIAIAEALEYTDKWGKIQNGTVANSEEFTSRECLEDSGWPEFFYFGIFDCKEGGKPLMSDPLRDPEGVPDETTGLLPEHSLMVEPNHVAVFRAGTLQLTLR